MNYRTLLVVMKSEIDECREWAHKWFWFAMSSLFINAILLTLLIMEVCK
jgi:hypothetical protein